MVHNAICVPPLHLAVCVPDNPEEILKAEENLAKTLQAAKEVPVTEKRKSRRAAKPSGVASAAQVAKALNEKRPVLTAAQKEAKKVCQQAAKRLKQAQQQTEAEQDQQVLRSVNRQLFSNDAMSGEEASSDSDNDNDNDNGMDLNVSSDDENEGDPDLGDFSKFSVVKLLF